MAIKDTIYLHNYYLETYLFIESCQDHAIHELAKNKYSVEIYFIELSRKYLLNTNLTSPNILRQIVYNSNILRQIVYNSNILRQIVYNSNILAMELLLCCSNEYRPSFKHSHLTYTNSIKSEARVKYFYSEKQTIRYIWRTAVSS